MARLVVQVGGVAVVIKDDRAELDKTTLNAWKAAARDLIEGAVDLLVEEVPDGE